VRFIDVAATKMMTTLFINNNHKPVSEGSESITANKITSLDPQHTHDREATET
jgi:hypothetical protein